MIRFLFGLCGALFGVLLFLVLDFGVTRFHIEHRDSKLKRVGECVVPDFFRHHAYRINCEGYNPWGPELFPVFTNSLGYRDSRIREVPRNSDKPRILLVGDSFADGLVEWRSTVAGQLEVLEPEWEVLNAGMGSYSPSNYVLVIEDAIRRGIHLDHVLVMLDISDVQDEAARYFDVGPNVVNVRSAGDIAPPKLYDSVLTNFASIRGLVWWWLSVQIQQGHYYLPSVWTENLFDAPRSAWTYRPNSAGFEVLEYPDGYAPLGVAGGLEKVRAKMSQIADFLLAKGVKLSLIVYPWPAQLAHASGNEEYVQFWRTWCRARCSGFFETFTEMENIKNSCPSDTPGCWYQKLYIFGDIHFTAFANGLLANKIRQIVIK